MFEKGNRKGESFSLLVGLVLIIFGIVTGRSYFSKRYLNQAMELLQKEQYDEAIPLLKKSIKIKRDSSAYHQLAIAYAKKGMVTNALDMCEEAIKIDPKTRVVMKDLYLQLKVMLEPQNLQNHLELGKYWSLYGMYDKAVQEFEYAIKIDSKNAEAYYSLAEVYYFQKEIERSYISCKMAVELVPLNKKFQTLLNILSQEREIGKHFPQYYEILELPFPLFSGHVNQLEK